LSSALLWFVSSGMAEFKVQRGVDATWFDLELAPRDSVGRTVLGFLQLRRHWVPGLFAWLATCAVLLAVRVRARTWPMTRGFAVVFGVVVSSVAGYVGALIPLDPHVRIFRTIGDRHVVGEPFVNLFAHFGRTQENVRLGMKGLIERA